MTLDLFSLQLMTSTVILIAACLYLLETLLRRDGAAGRLWSATFLAGVFSALCYLVWVLLPQPFVAVAIGNGAFVAATAFIWLGCVAFNGRSLRTAAIFATAVVAAVIVAALAEGPDGGDWAGGVGLFLGNAVFAVLGALETRRGAIGQRWSAAGLTVVLWIETVWFLGRTVVFVTAGPESELWRAAFDTATSNFLTIILVVATVVVTSVLRASESALRGQADTRTLVVDERGVLLPESFRFALGAFTARASVSGEPLVVAVAQMSDAGAVARAFGPEEAETIVRAFRESVRRHIPATAPLGEMDATTLTVAFTPSADADADRIAVDLHDRIVDDLAALGMSIVPVVGVGVATTAEVGYDAEALRDRALDAAVVATAGGAPGR